MSYLGTFYRDFANDGAAHLADLYETLVEAASWIEHAVEAHYGPAKEPYRFEQMPGYALGLRPLEIQVHKKTNKEPTLSHGCDSQGRHCTIWNEPTFAYQSMYGGESGTAKITNDMIHTLDEGGRVGAFYYSGDVSERLTYLKARDLYDKFLPKPSEKIFTRTPTGKRVYLPLLYSLELGETYYFYVDSISLLKRGGGTVSIKLAPSCIIAVNWITGQLHWIGYEQKLGSFARPDVYDRAVLIPPEKRQDIENAIFRNYYYGACAKRANALAALVPNSYYLPSDQEREDTKDAAKMDAQQMLSSYPLPPLGEAVAYDEQMVAVAPFAVYDTFMVQRAVGNRDVTPFLEALYDLPAGSLEWAPYKVNHGTTMQNFLWTIHYTGNLFQSILQTTAYSPWFLSTVLNSISAGGTSLDPSIRSLSQWFGLTKPELKALLSEPSGEKFIFSLAIRQFKPYSLKECERLYARVVGDCDANNMSHRNGTARWSHEMATIRGKHGRALLKTNRLPRAFILYMSENLQKKVPVTDFIKYMSQEIQPAYPALDTLDKVWQLLKDYNRMAKEIIPSCGFVLPHHILQAHDAMVSNYNQILEEKTLLKARTEKEGYNVQEATSFTKCYSGKPTNVYSDVKFVMLAPKAGADLYEEGIKLNHCVGAYTRDVMAARGSMLIYFLRKAKSPKEPLVTVQINRSKEKGGDAFYLFEIAGKGNRLPTDEERAFAEKWLVELNKYIEEKKAANGSMSKAFVDSFDPEIYDWLTIIGAPYEYLPSYSVSDDVDTNYVRLFRAAIEGVSEMTSLHFVQADIDNIERQIARYCKRLRLSKEATDNIMSFIPGIPKTA